MEALIERIAQEGEEEQQEKLQPKQDIAFSAQSQNLASILGFLGQTEAQSVQKVMTTGMCVCSIFRMETVCASRAPFLPKF